MSVAESAIPGSRGISYVKATGCHPPNTGPVVTGEHHPLLREPDGGGGDDKGQGEHSDLNSDF